MEDDIISQFDKTELLSVLQRNDYHSPEISESEDESWSKLPSGKNFVHVYDHPWRSDMNDNRFFEGLITIWFY